MRVAFAQLDIGGMVDHIMADVPSDGARWDDSPAPTVTLKSGSGGELRASTAATLGAATSTSDTATAKAKRVPCISTAGFLRWDEIVVGPNDSGQWEWGTIDGISASEALTMLDDLQYAYGAGSPVCSHRLASELTAADAASVERRAVAEWHYYVDGIKRRDSTLYIISRHAPRLSLTSTELLAEDPRVRRLVASNQRLDLLIRRIWERKVLPAIGAMWSPGSLVSGEAAEEALIYAVRAKLSIDAKDYDAADKLAELYTAALDRIKDSAIDLDEDGAIEDEVRGATTPRVYRG